MFRLGDVDTLLGSGNDATAGERSHNIVGTDVSLRHERDDCPVRRRFDHIGGARRLYPDSRDRG